MRIGSTNAMSARTVLVLQAGKQEDRAKLGAVKAGNLQQSTVPIPVPFALRCIENAVLRAICCAVSC